MKKIFLTLSIALLALTSCKKDYTCSCTSTYADSDGDSESEKTTIKITDVTKRTVQNSSDCLSYKTTYAVGAEWESITEDCTIEKK